MGNGMFRTCFRFEKEDIVKVLIALRIPETVVTAQRVPIPGDEALCITLRRLAYPNRLKDLENFFGRHSWTISSLTIEVLRHIDEKCFHLLDDVNNHSWLAIDTLENLWKAIYAKRAPLTNCWDFIDGTARAICRPTRQQQLYFSGHKRFHSLRYQSIMCPKHHLSVGWMLSRQQARCW
ncbi:uncharacterized protein LOC142776900 [Rhipicephalus microplus]|uniref:uncharacterized protein LOC142776900 n=1 Tax=Rhipicephalus microplus TaxID=6941 RepID=UPI003F6C0DC3